MEKVVIISGGNGYLSGKEDGINRYLDSGWTVKMIHTVGAKEYTTAIFVLEKK